MNEGKKGYVCSAEVFGKRNLTLAADKTVAMHDGTATDNVIGCSEYRSLAGEVTNVVLPNYPGTRELEAAGVITVLADVYAAADGKIQALPVVAGDYRKIGIALEGAGGDGEIIEVLPQATPEITTVS